MATLKTAVGGGEPEDHAEGEGDHTAVPAGGAAPGAKALSVFCNDVHAFCFDKICTAPRESPHPQLNDEI